MFEGSTVREGEGERAEMVDEKGDVYSFCICTVGNHLDHVAPTAEGDAVLGGESVFQVQCVYHPWVGIVEGKNVAAESGID